ncbi:MAG: tRNA uridine-5-carboxymethylaminomethyl(34) synthesis GTPase MnmE [Verrucomicrobiota bacterium]|nr:tRNA uridine-5-carboxymethylaminomethyl(34) synthesis GTPase MnmE [Verrucomicrobiota bacterium]
MPRRAQGSAVRELTAPTPLPWPTGETIAAISTPAGEGAIGLIRISGPEAVAIADLVFRGKQKPSDFVSHLQHYGEIVDAERVIDQVMLSVHRTPQSYTGEDLVEITGHGGVLVTAKVLAVCLQAGARAARGGEFTERAFLNGKMDLTQAEAVMDLIRAQTDLALRSATEQLEGNLGASIRDLRDGLIELLAHLEAAIDFPDEDISPDAGARLRARLAGAQEKIGALLSTSERGRILREGVRVVIYGATNAGKSSLLNRLLGYERAIVSPLPGTTRDTIEEVLNLRGFPIRLLDTAGLRASSDELEKAGMARTEKSLARADLALHLVDGSAPKPTDFQTRGPSEILLINKRDLREHADWRDANALRISCVLPDGLTGLEEALVSQIGGEHLRAESALAINARHQDCLRRAAESCGRAAATVTQDLSAEYIAVDVRGALQAVTEVIAAESDDPILDSLFANFCIGK